MKWVQGEEGEPKERRVGSAKSQSRELAVNVVQKAVELQRG